MGIMGSTAHFSTSCATSRPVTQYINIGCIDAPKVDGATAEGRVREPKLEGRGLLPLPRDHPERYASAAVGVNARCRPQSNNSRMTRLDASEDSERTNEREPHEVDDAAAAAAELANVSEV